MSPELLLKSRDKNVAVEQATFSEAAQDRALFQLGIISRQNAVDDRCILPDRCICINPKKLTKEGVEFVKAIWLELTDQERQTFKEGKSILKQVDNKIREVPRFTIKENNARRIRDLNTKITTDIFLGDSELFTNDSWEQEKRYLMSFTPQSTVCENHNKLFRSFGIPDESTARSLLGLPSTAIIEEIVMELHRLKTPPQPKNMLFLMFCYYDIIDEIYGQGHVSGISSGVVNPITMWNLIAMHPITYHRAKVTRIGRGQAETNHYWRMEDMRLLPNSFTNRLVSHYNFLVQLEKDGILYHNKLNNKHYFSKYYVPINATTIEELIPVEDGKEIKAEEAIEGFAKLENFVF